MQVSRRAALRMGAALAVVPWVGGVGHVSAAASAGEVFSTGSAKVDRALGGGVRAGSLIVVADAADAADADLAGDARNDTNSGLLARMAEVNGVSQVHSMNAAAGSDMLSLMRSPGGQRTGCLLVGAPEPSTDKEQADMQRDPGARDAFLSRWFKRAQEVARESGGIMAIRVRAAPAGNADWISIPDYVVTTDERVLKQI